MSWEIDTGNEQAGSPKVPPIKELYLERQGSEFLFRSGYTEFFEETKSLPFFEEIHLSCKTAIRELNVGTPKGLKAESIAEQEQLELLFIELRHGDLAFALKKYSSLIGKYAQNQVFKTALARTIKCRSTRSSVRQSLRFYVSVGWTYGFLWGLSHIDQAEALRRLYGVEIRSRHGAESEVVRKTIAKLKLKSWSDYRDTYGKPPLSLLLFREGQHDMCQFVFSSAGQF
jgi:hypothetical protein